MFRCFWRSWLLRRQNYKCFAAQFAAAAGLVEEDAEGVAERQAVGVGDGRKGVGVVWRGIDASRVDLDLQWLCECRQYFGQGRSRDGGNRRLVPGMSQL